MSRLLWLALATAAPALADDVPALLTHQGRLADADGVPLDGAHEIAISLYDASGNPLWTDTFPAQLVNGHFAIVLGSGLALPPSVFDAGHVEVGVAVDGEAELTPRQRISSVPYALRAQQAVGVQGGVVDATEIRIDGTLVIDGSGALVGGADPLAALHCGVDEVPVFDGVDWGCGALGGEHTHDAAAITSGTLDIARIPVGTGDTEVAAGSHTHALSELGGRLLASQLPPDLDGATTLGGQPILTGAPYTDDLARAAMGGKANTNALNHDRYSNSEAVTAMGAKANTNALNHDRYSNSEAVAAMGAKANTNALNHDRYTDADARAALSGGDIDLGGRSLWGIGNLFWGRLALDGGAFATSRGDTGTLAIPTANNTTACHSSGKVCVRRFNAGEYRIIFEIPSTWANNGWHQHSRVSNPGAFCWAATSGDNEVTEAYEGFGNGALSVSGDMNGHCATGSTMESCASVDVRSSSLSHDVFGVMCYLPK
jgi:hypothetical protein